MGHAAEGSRRPRLRLLHVQRRQPPRRARGQLAQDEPPRRHPGPLLLQVFRRPRPHLVARSLRDPDADDADRPREQHRGARSSSSGASASRSPSARRAIVRLRQGRQVGHSGDDGDVAGRLHAERQHPDGARPGADPLGAPARRRRGPAGAQGAGRPTRRTRRPSPTARSTPPIARSTAIPAMPTAATAAIPGRLPAYAVYTPGGRRIKHPRAANFVRKFSNGKFLYWFHNHGGEPVHAGHLEPLPRPQPRLGLRRRREGRPDPLVGARDPALRRRPRDPHQLPRLHRGGRPLLRDRDPEDDRAGA